MSETPKLPNQISSDGREVWDWAVKFSAHVHAQDEARKLLESIHKLETTCGSCRLWMTPQCPREVHNGRTGRWTGPNCNSPKCDKFIIKKDCADLIQEHREKLIDIEGSKP